MKLSLNWIKKFGPVDLTDDQLIQKIGAQIGSVEEVIHTAEQYLGARVVRVVECIPHPNADKLHLCKMDDNKATENVARDEQGLIQVVCGAPNIAAGLLVVWLLPGSTVPSSFGGSNPVVLEAKEIRGEVSNGMFASAKELALGDDHSGILIIDSDIAPGTSFIDAYELDDTIIDIENKMLTHRPDLFGELGLAREVSGVIPKPFHSPDWYQISEAGEGAAESLKLQVKNEIPNLVKRFSVQPISGVSVKRSNVEIQTYLARVGIRPINNIVDLTNYYMMLTGQPLHAYDYDKLKNLDGDESANIIVREASGEEEVQLLNGKTMKPVNGTIVICSESKLIGIGGVMGGSLTEVDETTKNIVIESASFDMYSIRRASMENGLFTEAVTRFNKGQSNLQNVVVLNKTSSEVINSAGGSLAGPVIDIKSELNVNEKLNISREFINSRLGLDISTQEIASLLTDVEFEVLVNGETIEVTAPFWRTDIHIPEDIVEEIGRLKGYDNFALKLPTREIFPAQKDPLIEFGNVLRDLLSQAGANEIQSYSFVHGQLLDNTGGEREEAYQLGNALSPDLQYYRLSLLPGLLDRVHSNIKAGYPEFAIFEIGKTHVKSKKDNDENSLPAENYRLGFVYAVDDKLAGQQYSGAAYYQASYYLDYILSSLNVASEITPVPKSELSGELKQLASPFEPVRSAYIYSGDQLIAVVGEPKKEVKNKLKLPKFTSMLEIDVASLSKVVSPQNYKKLSHYPKIEQDICFKLPSDVAYQTLVSLIKDELNKDESLYYNLLPIDIYQKEDDPETKQITLRISINSYESTLTNAQVSEIMQRFIAPAHSSLGAVVI